MSATNMLLIYTISAGSTILLLSLNGRDAFIPSHVSSREDVTMLYENSTSNDKYRYAMKKTLDLLWDVKCHVINARQYHRRLSIFDGVEIEYVADLLDELQAYLNLIGEIVTVKLEGTVPWKGFEPLNKTLVDKLSTDWNEIKGHVDKYQPKSAVEEYTKVCEEVNGALNDITVQSKPIYEMISALQNETQISEDERARMAEETTIISLVY